MEPTLETAMDLRARRAADLAALIAERGYAVFPRAGWGELTGERLREARRDLWQAVEDLADAGRPIKFVELDPGDAPAHYVWFSDSPPAWVDEDSRHPEPE